jgi:hypothetical protein
MGFGCTGNGLVVPSSSQKREVAGSIPTGCTKTFLSPLPLLPHQLTSYFDVGRHLSIHENPHKTSQQQDNSSPRPCGEKKVHATTTVCWRGAERGDQFYRSISNMSILVKAVMVTTNEKFARQIKTGYCLKNNLITGAKSNYCPKDNFFDATVYVKQMEDILNGMTNQRAESIDMHIVTDVTDHLFGNNGRRLDLIARNIQQGRDQGPPGYKNCRVHVE